MIDVICVFFLCISSGFIATFILDWKLRRNLLAQMQSLEGKYIDYLQKARDITEAQAKAMVILEDRLTACEFSNGLRKR